MPLYGVPVGSSDYRRSIGISLDINRYSDPKSCNVTDKKCDFNLFNDPNINTWADPMVYAVYEGRKPLQIAVFYSIFTYLYTAPLAVKANQRRNPVRLSPGKRKDLRRRGVG